MYDKVQSVANLPTFAKHFYGCFFFVTKSVSAIQRLDIIRCSLNESIISVLSRHFNKEQKKEFAGNELFSDLI